MNFFEKIKSEQGEENYVFKKEYNYIKTENNSISNYEFLSELGAGGFGKVFKVRYKLDNRIYALKELIKVEGNLEKYLKREIELLSELKHSHIIKYYDSFIYGENTYLVLEYMENGSLKEYLDTFKKMKNIKIKNELVWNLFMQCISSLVYIHSKNIIHRDIKPHNILIDNNMRLKITDFGVSIKLENNEEKYLTKILSEDYSAPEMNLNEEGIHQGKAKYNEKIDIYSLGRVFQDFSSYIENQEDKEFKVLIDSMTKINPNERPSAKEVYDKVENIYMSKYFKNTCMDSLIRCLYSLKPMTSYFLNLDNFNILNTISIYIRCLESFTKENINDWFDSVGQMRLSIENRISLPKTNGEIEPFILFVFVFKELNNELDNPIHEEKKENKDFISNLELNQQKNKNEEKQKYINRFFLKQNTYITNNFMGLIKEIRICKGCNVKTYNFKSYFCITFDLAKITSKLKNKDNKLNLEDCFDYEKQEEKLKSIMCCNCHKFTTHSVFKFIYSGSIFLVINIKNDSKDGLQLYLNEVLDLKEHIEFQNLPTKFVLKGILKKKEEIYLSNINIENSWFRCEKKQIDEINFQPTKETNENIIMLFYQSVK